MVASKEFGRQTLPCVAEPDEGESMPFVMCHTNLNTFCSTNELVRLIIRSDILYLVKTMS